MALQLFAHDKDAELAQLINMKKQATGFDIELPEKKEDAAALLKSTASRSSDFLVEAERDFEMASLLR